MASTKTCIIEVYRYGDDGWARKSHALVSKTPVHSTRELLTVEKKLQAEGRILWFCVETKGLIWVWQQLQNLCNRILPFCPKYDNRVMGPNGHKGTREGGLAVFDRKLLYRTRS